MLLKSSSLTVLQMNRLVGDRMKMKRGISERQHELFQIAMNSLAETSQYQASENETKGLEDFEKSMIREDER